MNTILLKDAELMLIDQDIVPPHSPHCMSVLQPVYKQLPPDNVICLKAGDELIIVVSAITAKTDKAVGLVLQGYFCVFQRVIEKLLTRMYTQIISMLYVLNG